MQGSHQALRIGIEVILSCGVSENIFFENDFSYSRSAGFSRILHCEE